MGQVCIQTKLTWDNMKETRQMKSSVICGFKQMLQTVNICWHCATVSSYKQLLANINWNQKCLDGKFIKGCSLRLLVLTPCCCEMINCMTKLYSSFEKSKKPLKMICFSFMSCGTRSVCWSLKDSSQTFCPAASCKTTPPDRTWNTTQSHQGLKTTQNIMSSINGGGMKLRTRITTNVQTVFMCTILTPHKPE